MRSIACIASIGWLAAALAMPALAGDRDARHQDRSHHRDHQRPRIESGRPAMAFEGGMQAVPHDAGPDAAAYGWQYFSDPEARRAVVISPRGDYYYSHGKGLRLVVSARSGA